MERKESKTHVIKCKNHKEAQKRANKWLSENTMKEVKDIQFVSHRTWWSSYVLVCIVYQMNMYD